MQLTNLWEIDLCQSSSISFIILCRYNNENLVEVSDWTFALECHILTPKGTFQDGTQPVMNVHKSKYSSNKFGASIIK